MSITSEHLSVYPLTLLLLFGGNWQTKSTMKYFTRILIMLSSSLFSFINNIRFYINSILFFYIYKFNSNNIYIYFLINTKHTHTHTHTRFNLCQSLWYAIKMSALTECCLSLSLIISMHNCMVVNATCTVILCSILKAKFSNENSNNVIVF